MLTHEHTPHFGLSGRPGPSPAGTGLIRRVYLSFRYSRDLYRVRKIRRIPRVRVWTAAGLENAQSWQGICRNGEAGVKNVIDGALAATSVTVVCIGQTTAYGRYIDYELERSLDQGNGLVGVHISHLPDEDGTIEDNGPVPLLIKMAGYKIYDYSGPHRLAVQIEEAARLAER